MDGVIFSKVATVCMGVRALATLAHVFRGLLHDLDRNDHERMRVSNCRSNVEVMTFRGQVENQTSGRSR